MERKRKLVTAMQVKLFNPPSARSRRAGWCPASRCWRRPGATAASRAARRSPTASSAATNTFWIVAEMGRKAAYVRNIEADPRVRVRVRGRWRTGTAHVLDGEDPRARLRSISRLNAPACARWAPTCSSSGSTSTP